MPNPLDITPATQIATLILFEWGETPNRAGYIRWDTDVVVDGISYSAVPVLDVDYGEQDGGTNSQSVKIQISKTLTPIDKLIGQEYGEIIVTIMECDPTNALATLRKMFKGSIGKVSINVAGRANIARLEVNGWKKLLTIPLGIICDTRCPWTFGDLNCQVSLAPLKIQAPIVSIDKNLITVDNAGIIDKDEFYWHWGQIEIDGYPIMIRFWKDGGVFNMTKIPPADWVGQIATFTPGCNKTIGTGNSCRYWQNESNFGGIGIAMPDRNPLLEVDE